jgi:ketoreductase
MADSQRVALVSGATSGMGLQITKNLAAQGVAVFICARDEQRVADTAKQLQDDGFAVDGVGCDVRDAAQLREYVDAGVRRFGPVDILVNNAGRSGGGVTAQIEDQLWLDVIETNLHSVFYATKAALTAGGMLERGSGRIVNIASTGGKQGVLHGAPYSASKHGVVGFTKALGLELAKTGITVNAVCPGYVDTPMTAANVASISARTGRPHEEVERLLADRQPHGRLVTADEVADAVLFCLSAASLNGQGINVDGGAVQS